jgi:hypothetical protein
MLKMRKIKNKFCTRTFAFYMLTKNGTTNIGTGARHVLVGPMHAATIIQLKIKSMTTVFEPNNGRLPLQLKIALYSGKVSYHT